MTEPRERETRLLIGRSPVADRIDRLRTQAQWLYTPGLDGAAGTAGTARLALTVPRGSALGAAVVVHGDLGLGCVCVVGW